MKVELKYYTPVNVALEAGLICTDSEDKIDNYNAFDFISKLIKQGHDSVIEHLNFTFCIDGVSRSLLQELSRHRHISLSVKSTRWALKKFADKVEYYNPLINYAKTFLTTDEMTDLMLGTLNEEKMNELKKVDIIFDEIVKKSEELKVLINEAIKAKVPNDVLKYYLQESITTKLMMTCNLRELRHIFQLRTSNRALQEFRDLCLEIYKVLPKEYQRLTEDVMLNIEQTPFKKGE